MAEKVEGKVYASDKPWLKYWEKIGLYAGTGAPYPELALHEWVEKYARMVPDSPMLYFRGGKWTWKEVLDPTYRFATALADLGVKKGDCVTEHLMNSVSFAIADLACSKIGASNHWAATMLPRNELVRQMNKIGTKVAICRDIDADYFKGMKEETKLETIIVTSMKDFSPEEDPKPKEISGTYQMRDLIEKYPPNPPKVDIDPTKDSLVTIFTAGSTGLPKGVSITHYNVSCAWIQALVPIIGGAKGFEYLTNIVAGMDIPNVNPVLMYHLGGEVFAYFITIGLPTVIIPDNRDYDAIAAAIEEYRPVLNQLVPGQFVKVEERLGEMPFLCLPGSAPLAPVVSDKIEDKGGGVSDAYGQTEAACVCTINLSSLLFKMLPEGVVKNGLPLIRKALPILSVLAPLVGPIPISSRDVYPIMRIAMLSLMSSGRKTGDAQRKKEKGLIKPGIGTPVIDNDVKLIDPDTGEEVPAGVPGEYCYKGRQVATYLPPVPETGYTEDGYLRSGDVMIMDEDGFMDIVDRTKDMVNVAGFKVYTETLDNVLAEHPAVEMSGSIAVADPDRPGAEQVKTFVQMREGYKPSKKLEEELTDLVAKKCLPYYKPKYYEFLEELPLTRADKIDKLYLREREKKKVRGEKVEELKTIKY